MAASVLVRIEEPADALAVALAAQALVLEVDLRAARVERVAQPEDWMECCQT